MVFQGYSGELLKDAAIAVIQSDEISLRDAYPTSDSRVDQLSLAAKPSSAVCVYAGDFGNVPYSKSVRVL